RRTGDSITSKPELKRKHNTADDDRHHERHSKARRPDSRRDDDPNDALMKQIFRPVRDSLKRVQYARKENIKSQKERAKIMKQELLVIGDYIEKTKRENANSQIVELIPTFWSYVASIWPGEPGPQASQLESMYKRIHETTAQAPATNGSSDSPAAANAGNSGANASTS
ncbi:hypothetical protein DH86_00003541, partial [Scytalidium sp. 3C]